MVRWFGGHVTSSRETTRLPNGVRTLTGSNQSVWTAGTWPDDELRITVVGGRLIAILGPCSATEYNLNQLADKGVPDGVLTMFAGSYTVVESTPAATTVLTDPSHVQPIYLATTPTGTLWGSSARALAALTGATPDLGWLATLLSAPDRPYLLAGRSAFSGVLAAPPGSRLTIVRGRRPVLQQVWRPAQPDSGIDDGARRLRAALTDAVAVRVDTRRQPSTDCSGGLDSTALTLLAAARLGDRAQLHAITAHPSGVEVGGDLDCARAALAGRSPVTHLSCALDVRHLPYSRMNELLPATDEPAPGTVPIARTVAEFELLRRIGSDCHLTGDGGDTVLGSHPAYLTDVAAIGRPDRLVRHAIGWARLRRCSVRPFLTAAIGNAAALRRGRRPIPHPDSHPTWSTEVTRNLVVNGNADGTVPRPGEYATARLIEAVQAVGRTARCDIQIAEHYGSSVHNPFLDPLVVAAALAVPSWLRAEPFRYKPLLTTALAGVFPSVIATRRTKGDFTPDHYLGLRANSDALHALADGTLAENGLIDPAPFHRLLTRAAAGMPVDLGRLEPVLAAEVWLRAIRSGLPAAHWADPDSPTRART